MFWHLFTFCDSQLEGQKTNTPFYCLKKSHNFSAKATYLTPKPKLFAVRKLNKELENKEYYLHCMFLV